MCNVRNMVLQLNCSFQEIKKVHHGDIKMHTIMKLARRVMDGFEINFEHFTEIDKRQYRNLNTTKCKSMTT